MDEEKLSAEDERRLLEAFEQASLNDYPNPDRIGCPGSAFLKRLAFDRKSVPVTHPDLNHVTHCSPCFREFIEFRNQARHRKRSNRVAALAAIVVLTIGLSVYFAARGGRLFWTPSGRAPVSAASLDLKNFVLLRGLPESNSQASAETRQLHQGNLALTVTLPLASEPGIYEFEVLREPDKPLAFAKGQAHLTKGLTVVSVRLDLSTVPPGGYFWGIRRDSQSWAYCPIRVVP